MKSVRITLAVLLLFCGTMVSHAQTDDSSFIVEVVNSEGHPLKNACVTFVPKSGDIVFRKGDNRGRVKVKKLPRGTYRVVVKVDGYEAQKKEVAVARPNDTVAFVMQPRNDR